MARMKEEIKIERRNEHMRRKGKQQKGGRHKEKKGVAVVEWLATRLGDREVRGSNPALGRKIFQPEKNL